MQPYPRNERSCSGENSAHSWDRQHFILTSPSWSTARFLRANGRQSIHFFNACPPAFRSSPCHWIDGSISIPPRRGMCPHLPSLNLPETSKKLENVGSRKTVVMCHFAGTGLSLCSKATRNFSQSRRSSLLKVCTTRTMGPSCNGPLFDYSSALPYTKSDISLGTSRLANTRGHLLGSTSHARGGLGCWLLAVGSCLASLSAADT